MENDTPVQELVDPYGGWFRKSDYENRAGGTGRMTKDLYPCRPCAGGKPRYLQPGNDDLINKPRRDDSLRYKHWVV